jgi:hypothetical protein
MNAEHIVVVQMSMLIYFFRSMDVFLLSKQTKVNNDYAPHLERIVTKFTKSFEYVSVDH